MKNYKRSKLAVLFVLVVSIFPKLGKILWKYWYNFLAKKDTGESFEFMNYGFDAKNPIHLNPEDEHNRYSIQLYNQLIESTDCYNKDLLEVGCGRGGGLSFLERYFQFSSLTGVDLSDQAIDKCKINYKDRSIKFIQGSADNLPCSDKSLDIVINVESSHCYPDVMTFIKEVHRVLRFGGYFCLCDIRPQTKVEELEDNFKASGFSILKKINITEQVLSALDKLTDDRVNISNKFPVFLQAAFIDFAGLKSSAVYQMMKDGKLVYMSYQLQK